MGSIVLSRDLTLTQRQVELTMVSGDAKSTWQQVYNPIKQTYFISEDGGKYAYFLENLELSDGKVFLHQLSFAGNIKVMNVSFLAPLKRLGNFSPSDLYLTDIITTEKALIWMFRYKDKDKLTTIAVSMTHHNFNLYAFIVSENVTGSSKVEDQISWYIAGEKGENIVFAARMHAGKEAGWKVKEFNPKGVMVSEQSLDQKGINFMAHTRVGFGRRGSALLKRSEPDERGTLIFANGFYFVGGIEQNGTAVNVVSYRLEDKKWVKACESVCTVFNPKNPLEVGCLRMSEGIGWYVNSADSEGHFHSFTSSVGIMSGSIDQATSNPSRLLTAEFPSKFVAELDTKWLIFDTKQLPAKGNITFEYKQK
ncbi:hypothetical protein [Fluviicola sp.]|uniref:hypothetical protein n=1 Tax=Fluviicola sp. TaxID=1917219 RepID=UPI002817F3D1|nr:hypothetical protein [Fluviicola sp.]MDR0801537.1 hypothetical protein [Fluviicola sp.]